MGGALVVNVGVLGRAAGRAWDALSDEAAAEGFLPVRAAGRHPRAGTGESAAPEVTLGPDAWYWDRTLSTKVAGPGVDLAEVKRLVVEEILNRAQGGGCLPRACSCIGP